MPIESALGVFNDLWDRLCSERENLNNTDFFVALVAKDNSRWQPSASNCSQWRKMGMGRFRGVYERKKKPTGESAEALFYLLDPKYRNVQLLSDEIVNEVDSFVEGFKAERVDSKEIVKFMNHIQNFNYDLKNNGEHSLTIDNEAQCMALIEQLVISTIYGPARESSQFRKMLDKCITPITSPSRVIFPPQNQTQAPTESAGKDKPTAPNMETHIIWLARIVDENLTMMEDRDKIAVLPKDKPTVIGREPSRNGSEDENHVGFIWEKDKNLASARHATIRYNVEKRTWSIKDGVNGSTSTNGTGIRGRNDHEVIHLKPDVEYELFAYDTVFLGLPVTSETERHIPPHDYSDYGAAFLVIPQRDI